VIESQLGTHKEHNKIKIDGQIDKSQGLKLPKSEDGGTGFPTLELDSTQ
jgi:hypothetical protein